MTTSKSPPREVYVWTWLPNQVEPVVAGVIRRVDSRYVFNYGNSYLERADAVSLFNEELPFIRGEQLPRAGLTLAGCLRDGSPDAWGRRVILHRLFGVKGREIDSVSLDELTFFLESNSDRIGSLDFQESSSEYKNRSAPNASLEELLNAVDALQTGQPLSIEISSALFHGTSLGGARPKAFIDTKDRKYIVKFSTSNDHYSVVKGEFIAMRLAKQAGLNVANVEWKKVSDKDVLIVERFDRLHTEKGWSRKSMISGLTLLGLDEMMARYASYQDLAEKIRAQFVNPKESLRELFGRMVFNILVGNSDDHARNHSAFWDGKTLSLTPAYDICPQSRSGNETSQAMLIFGEERASRLEICLRSAHIFLLKDVESKDLISNQIERIKSHWNEVCEACDLSHAERNFFWGRQFMNPFAFENSKFEEEVAKKVF